MIEKNMLGRRRFLRSTAASIIGATGAMAATGTATAQSNRTPGNVTIRSNSNDWNYQVSMSRPYDTKPRIKKRGKADSSDEISSSGATARGEVFEDHTDTYRFPDAIIKIFVSPLGRDSGVLISVGSYDGTHLTRIDATGERFDYDFSYDGRQAFVDKQSADKSDTVVNGYRAKGHVNPGDPDSYAVYGYLSDISISDPYSGAERGWVLEFDPV